MKEHSRFENKTVMMLTALCCCIAWGSAFPGIKLSFSILAVDSEFEKILLGGLRYMLSGAGVLVYARLKLKKSIMPTRKELPFTLLIAFLQTFGGMTLGYIGISYVTAVKSSILVPTSVFMVAILAHFMFKRDRLNWKKVLGLFLGFAGVVIVNVSMLSDASISFRLVGEGFILMAVAMGALTVILIRKYGGCYDIVRINGWQLLLGGLCMAVAGFAGHPQLPDFDVVSGALFVYLAAVSGIAFTLWFALLKYHNASLLEQYKFIIPLFGSVLSVLILPGEHIGIEILIAAILVSIGTIIVNRQDTSGAL